MTQKKDLKEIVKIGVVDLKFGPKKYVGYMVNRSRMLERQSIDAFAYDIANVPGIYNPELKIDYDNKSASEQYEDVRQFNEEELSYLKEKVIIYRNDVRRNIEEYEKNHYIPFQEKPKKLRWVDEKHPHIK